MLKATNAGFDTLDTSSGPGIDRRTVLAAGAGLTVAGCAKDPGDGHRGPAHGGVRQPGVTTPQQRAALVLAYDLDAGTRQLRAVLRTWGRALKEDRTPTLTATVGLGPRLAAPALRELPPFPGDRLDPARCGGDLLLQLRADDPRALTRAAPRFAHPALRPRWRQRGFLPPAPPGSAPRNLLGFKDGSANPTPEECERWVWTPDGGTFLVVRRVHLRVTEFTRLTTRRQEEIVGRRRADGAPLDGGRETDDVDVFAKTPQGRYITPLGAHVRAASPRLDAGARMLRRGYSYDDGPDDRGLLFLAYMRDPGLFVRVQRRMAAQDELSRFSEHRGSAVAYVPPMAELWD
ncbi:Dyp-type peroxidase [Streptomyces sp. S.PB5]|uniref:Dyp-type peroxidase n=1 Tax=Streptomyces sp. S.PB5 TaxID=3020844 RepID=UPI0025B20C4A|nr:Dyp-type peroxidase [Streptomyces sp. S.PB5]MDN3020285.1 Dyp-type peroxidase [Streptomyces sp. S.PB5]